MFRSRLPQILGSALLAVVWLAACDDAGKPGEKEPGAEEAAQIENLLQTFEQDIAKKAAEKADEATERATETVAALEGDAEAGAKVFRKCAVCHTAGAGDGHKVGPNLWNIVGQPKGAAAGFIYSKAMAEAGGDWTEADLDAYLASPKAFIPDNRMAFAGIRKATDRADLIAYLKTLKD